MKRVDAMLISENNTLETLEPVEGLSVVPEMDKPQSRIIKTVCDGIRMGVHRPGEQLRLREAYMKDFSASKVTVQRAFARLIADGFVTARASQGTFVAARPPNLFRIALVYNQIKSEALQDKYRLSIVNAAAPYDRHHPDYTLVPYYGMDFEQAGSDRQRLVDDLNHGRLAAVIHTYDHRYWPDDPRLAHIGIPQVHWGESRGAGYSSVRLANALRASMAEVKRLGGKKVAVIISSKAMQMIDELMGLAAEMDLEIRPQWLHGVDKLHPAWADAIMQTVFSLPEAMRPDSVFVADDHFVEAAGMGLVKAGVANTVKAVFHANFPVAASSPIPAVRVGVDAAQILRATLGILETLWNADRSGQPRPDLAEEVPIQVDTTL